MPARILAWLALALTTVPSVATASEYPTRPITIIVSLAAGGVSDTVTRLYAETITKQTGYNFVVDNRPTGSGAVAAAALQNAAPDGYTVYVLAGAQHTTIPAIGNVVAYDPIKGNQPVTLLFSMPTLLTVPADSPIRSLSEFVDYAKKRDGGLTVGSPGVGTPAHLSGAKLLSAVKAPVQFVHYRGGGPMLTDLLASRLDAAVLSSMTAKGHLQSKKLVALSSDGAERWRGFNEIPILKELGLADATIATWFGLVVPPATPSPIVRKLNEMFVNASKDAALQRRLLDDGLLVVTSTPDEMRQLLQNANTEINELVRTLGLNKQ